MCGHCLDVAYASHVPGANICIAKQHPAQVWRMIPTEKKDCYYIQSNVSRLFLCGCGGASSHATQNSSTHKDIWRFIPSVKKGGYYIENVSTGLHLHVLAGAKEPGSLVGVAGPHPAGVWNLELGPENPPYPYPPSSSSPSPPPHEVGKSLDTTKFIPNAIVDLHSTQWAVEVFNPFPEKASCVLRVSDISVSSGYRDYPFNVAGQSTERVLVNVSPNVQTTFKIVSAVSAK